MSFALKNTFKEAEEAKFNWDFSVEPQTVFEYIAQVLSWMRLCMLESTGTGDDSNNNTFSGTEYWLNKVLIFNALQEDWGAEATIGFGEQILFDALATKFDAPRGFRRVQDRLQISLAAFEPVEHAENHPRQEPDQDACIGSSLGRRDQQGQGPRAWHFCRVA